MMFLRGANHLDSQATRPGQVRTKTEIRFPREGVGVNKEVGEEVEAKTKHLEVEPCLKEVFLVLTKNSSPIDKLTFKTKSKETMLNSRSLSQASSRTTTTRERRRSPL